jgi:FkbH-like protein
MLLTESHFVAMRINWEDKAGNIRSIAKELNIGLESIVFVDDQPFETELVKTLIPKVSVITLPKDCTQYVRALKQSFLFDRIGVTTEDTNRSKMMKGDKQRVASKQQFKTLSEYYQSLEMVVTIQMAEESSLLRLSQLTKKTNQFNSSLKRYQEAELKDLMLSSDTDVFSISLQDKFGQLGIVGVAILKYEQQTCIVDTFLMSCRVLGRKIETVFLGNCIDRAKMRKCDQVFMNYQPTDKNQQMIGFFEKNGSKIISKNDAMANHIYLLRNSIAVDQTIYREIIILK